MRPIPKKILNTILKDTIEKIHFPFLWGKETLYYLYYFQKGEENELLNSLKAYKDFQEWSNNNISKLDEFIEKLNKIEDLRDKFLDGLRHNKKEIVKLKDLIKDIEDIILKNLIPIPKDIQIPKKEILGWENFVWESLSFYLKLSRFITYSINFKVYPKISNNFYFKGKKVYIPNTPYKIEEEKEFLINLFLSWCGIPISEEVEFSLINNVYLEEKGEPQSMEIIEDIFIFRK